MKHKRIAVVVNPVSGGGRGRKAWQVIFPGLKAIFEMIECRVSNRSDDIKEITASLLETNPDYLLVIGGDGTLSQALNGFFEKDKPRASATRFAYFNAGCGGDFARLFGPQHVTEFLNRLAHDEHHMTNVGKIEFGNNTVRYFINVASCGLSAHVVQHSIESKWLKKLGGSINYFLHAILGLFTYKPFPVTIQLDSEEPIDSHMLMIAVGNGQYFGGKMHVTPMARIDDDLLDVVMILEGRILPVLLKLRKIYSGTHLKERKVHYRQVKRIRIQSNEPMALPVEADGEKVGQLPVDISLLEDKLAIIV